jgi:hypothetical protein
MWRIRVDTLYSEVGGNIASAEVTFKVPGGERKLEGKVTGPGQGYEFTIAGQPGELIVEHGDRVIVEFEVLTINSEQLPTEEKANEY